jgi:hypothetical protein
MQSARRLDSRFVLRTAAAGLISACWLQPAVAVASTEQALDPAEAQAQASWRADIALIAVPADGCFHAAYPNLFWEQVACGVGQPRVHSVPPTVTGGVGGVVGNGHDYAAGVTGLISKAYGTFPSVTGVTKEKSVGVAAFGGGGILGPNEYTLQLNTNFLDTTTSACDGHSGCLVWQQFIYSTDYLTDDEAEVFMQYWLIGWGTSACPSGFGSDGAGDCYGNSSYAAVPDLKIKDLGGETLTGSAVSGGNDTVTFTYGGDSYAVSGKDSVLDIATVWNLAEFNVVGDAGGSRADFNTGSSVTVNLAVTSGSAAKPACLKNAGTTGETNNLKLGACTRSGGATPAIEFTESN